MTGKAFASLALGVLLLHFQPRIASAGEVFIHFNPTCAKGYINSYFTFAVSETFSCVTTPAGYKGVSSARVIDPGCTVKVYTDTSCKSLSHTVSTSSGSGNCLSVPNNIRSVSASCSPSKAVPRSIDQTVALEQDFPVAPLELTGFEARSSRLVRRGGSNALDGGNIFFQPRVTWDHFPAGGNSKSRRCLSWIRTDSSSGVYINSTHYFGGGGGPPQGSLASDAQYMTEQLLAAAAGSRSSSVTVDRRTPGGVRYELEVEGEDTTAVGVIQAMGPAVLAAVLADGKP